MALGSSQPVTEMSTRRISWGKGSQCVRLTTSPLSCAVVMKSGNLNFLEPSGPLQACNRTAFTIAFIRTNSNWSYVPIWNRLPLHLHFMYLPALVLRSILSSVVLFGICRSWHSLSHVFSVLKGHI